MVNLAKIYTKTGDKGTTSLVNGKRISKADIRVNCYGTVDELNSFIGLALSQISLGAGEVEKDIRETFHTVQTKLFYVGADLSTPATDDVKWRLEESDIQFLEKKIDEWTTLVPELTSFILPGGVEAAASFHVARTICRRAERTIVSIIDVVNPLSLQYVNRLSDFLFVAARYINYLHGNEDTILKTN